MDSINTSYEIINIKDLRKSTLKFFEPKKNFNKKHLKNFYKNTYLTDTSLWIRK
jgi:hypothetical protein